MKNFRIYTVFLMTIVFSMSACLSHTEKSSHSPNKNIVKEIQYYQGIPVLYLTGTYSYMGQRYGAILHTSLADALTIIKGFYIVKGKYPYEVLEQRAETFFQQYPKDYQDFLIGVSIGSKIELNDIKILNAMESINIPRTINCAFVYFPGYVNKNYNGIIARNYDLPSPDGKSPLYDQIAKNLAVTILAPDNKIPVAIIAMPGEIYCPSCINAKGLFLELNGGAMSGGSKPQKIEQTMLITMLLTAQNSSNLTEAVEKLSSLSSDFSLIVNVADENSMASFEYSTALKEMHTYYPDLKDNRVFVSTNFFLNPEWGSAIKPPPESWDGVVRRNNLINLLASKSNYNIADVQAIMSVSKEQGGAVFNTIYQIIYDNSEQMLYLKINARQDNIWVKIPLWH